MTDAERVAGQLPLTPLSLHILVALSHGPLHGYAIVKAVRRSPTGGMDPGTGTFYSALHRMEGEGLIREVDVPDGGDSRRRHYAVTGLGREVLRAEARRLESVLGEARSVIEGG